jgi:hypothetical protein
MIFLYPAIELLCFLTSKVIVLKLKVENRGYGSLFYQAAYLQAHIEQHPEISEKWTASTSCKTAPSLRETDREKS